MKVQGINALYEYVTDKGWKDITEVKMQPWGSKMCSVTSPDGSILRFYE